MGFKIKSRSIFTNPILSLQIFLIPLLTYFFGKISGLKYHSEFIWWIILPLLLMFWFITNFKFVKNGRKNN